MANRYDGCTLDRLTGSTRATAAAADDGGGGSMDHERGKDGL